MSPPPRLLPSNPGRVLRDPSLAMPRATGGSGVSGKWSTTHAMIDRQGQDGSARGPQGRLPGQRHHLCCARVAQPDGRPDGERGAEPTWQRRLRPGRADMTWAIDDSFPGGRDPAAMRCEAGGGDPGSPRPAALRRISIPKARSGVSRRNCWPMEDPANRRVPPSAATIETGRTLRDELEDTCPSVRRSDPAFRSRRGGAT